jgi:hypothetical protein
MAMVDLNYFDAVYAGPQRAPGVGSPISFADCRDAKFEYEIGGEGGIRTHGGY